MKILDTNFIFSLLNKADVNHKKAADIFLGLDEDVDLKVPYIVAAELAISRKGSYLVSIARKISKRFVSSTEKDLEFIESMPYDVRKKIKSNDCLILAICKRNNAELITFDKNLSKVLHNLQSF